MHQYGDIIRSMLKDGGFGSVMPEVFSESDSLLNRGIIDSFGLFRFVRELEKSFQIKILDKEIHPANFETIENICAFIGKKTHPAS